jgi:hypothetical protein
MRHMRGCNMVSAIRAAVVGVCVLTGACVKDGVGADDDIDDPDGGGGGPDANVGDRPCDLSGRWIAEQHTVSVALATDQRATNWYYFEITQSADRFTIERALHCGFVVDGSTTVVIDDATLAALAGTEMAGPGRQGTYAPIAGGEGCRFELDRIYNVRGADKAAFLTDHWRVGDAARPLAELPTLPTAPPGMQDWDGDNMDGITLRSGFGNRYVCQRDWNEHSGTTPVFAARFGGPGEIVVKWDSQEGISTQTPPLLRTTATPKGDGWARYARAPDLDVSGTDLQTCRAVQQLAQQTWP